MSGTQTLGIKSVYGAVHHVQLEQDLSAETLLLLRSIIKQHLCILVMPWAVFAFQVQD